MPQMTFKESFSLSGAYYKEGSTHNLSEEDAAAVPEWVAEEVEAPPPENEESDAPPPEGEGSKSTASTKTKTPPKT
jgi:hypothetical protein